jgi:hypothetical protein
LGAYDATLFFFSFSFSVAVSDWMEFRYGDFAPKSTGTRMFTVVFIFIGISGAGYALGIVGSYLLKRQEILLEKLKNRTAYQENEKAK